MAGAVILLSGGLDSTTLLHVAVKRLAIRDIVAFTFLYGQKHSRELDVAAWQAANAGIREHRVIELGCFKALALSASVLMEGTGAVPDWSSLVPAQADQPPTYVPNRNMVLLSLAAAGAEALGAATVLYGAQKQDRYGYWDCTSEFIARLNAVLGLNRRRAVTIQAPFVDLGKADIIRIGMELGVDYARTWTCYRGQERSCGVCPACVDRLQAFQKAGVKDPLEYSNSPARVSP
ncbi:MAG: 7-cyano-7-deazaguanine synthase QueC [Lentisphaerae bacterium]|nr:7-cyano-7-deazaguanine synthase QueC [Lentisphaerota bacterium]